MKEIKYFNNEYIFIANCLLLISYLQSNMLVFRLFFIAACIFFVIFSLTTPVVAIDGVIFNILFTLMNIILSIPLIKNLIPPNLNPEQKEIFRNHFKNYLIPIELDHLLKKGRRRIYRVSTGMIKVKNEFSSLFFIAKIGKNCNVELKTKKRIFDLNVYSWIGIPEYLNVISSKESLFKALKDFDTGEWGVSLNIFVDENSVNKAENDSGIFEKNDNTLGGLEFDDKINICNDTYIGTDEDYTVIVYEFELRHIHEVFSDASYGLSIMRGLHSIWLKYCSDIVRRVDVATSGGADLTTTKISRGSDRNRSLEKKKIALGFDDKKPTLTFDDKKDSSKFKINRKSSSSKSLKF